MIESGPFLGKGPLFSFPGRARAVGPAVGAAVMRTITRRMQGHLARLRVGCHRGCRLAGRRSAQDLRIVETDDLQVVYFDPSGTYLAPYVTQSFLNSLNAQKKLFGYQPDGKVSILLQDFSDRGNASAILGAPRNRIFIDVAPPVLSFETFSPGERVYTLSNHELVHTVVGDQASHRGRDSAPLAGRQGRAGRGASRNAFSTTTSPIRAPPRRAGTRKAVPSSWRPGTAADSVARRAATTRWSSAPWCATRPRSTTRWAWCPRAPRWTSSPARMRTSTARAS